LVEVTAGFLFECGSWVIFFRIRESLEEFEEDTETFSKNFRIRHLEYLLEFCHIY
jgi:hypothetical protein